MRPGKVAPLLIFSLSALVCALAVAVNISLLWMYRVEMQATGDAAADAAAATLVDDDLLRNDPSLMPALLDAARDAAIDYASRNRVKGQPVVLDPNPTNDPEGDITFGILDTPRDPNFVLPGDTSDPTNTDLPRINAVRVRLRRLNERGNPFLLVFGQFTGVGTMSVQTATTVTLDRDIIGFRPFTNPIPLSPLALFSDPTGADTRSWDFQITNGNAPDNLTYDRVNKVFTAGPDQLREFSATLATDAGQIGTTNVAMLTIGITDMAGRINQLQNGMTAADFAAFGGELVLNAADNRLTVPGTEQGPAVGSTDLDDLYNALVQLRLSAAVRMWPLYSGVEAGTGNPILCGFVAGRVAEVDAPSAGQPLSFRIQPTMTSNAAAVTDASRRGVGGIAIVNPYIAKVRFVE